VREDRQRIDKYGSQGKFRPKAKTKFGRLGFASANDDDRENPEVALKAAAERKKAREQAALRSGYRFSVTDVEVHILPPLLLLHRSQRQQPQSTACGCGWRLPHAFVDDMLMLCVC
jgi:hypothetical protein